MTLGKVIGNVVSTIKSPDYDAYKLLLVQPVDQQGTPKGKTMLAIDAVQAGVGDTVIVIDEGGSARTVLDTPDIRTIRTVIVGIVDEVDTGVSKDTGVSSDVGTSNDTGVSIDTGVSSAAGAANVGA